MVDGGRKTEKTQTEKKVTVNVLNIESYDFR